MRDGNPRRWLMLLLAGWLAATAAAASAQPVAPRSTRADEDYYMATYYFGQKKWLDAAEAFAKFVKDYPAEKRAADAQFGHGQSLYQLGRYKDAADSFQVMLDAHPASEKAPAALFQLGQAHLNAGQLDQAVAAFTQVSAKHPKHYLAEWADAMQASCLITQQKYARAAPLLAGLIDKYVRGKDAAAHLADKRKELSAVNPQLVDAFDEVLETAELNMALALHGQQNYEQSAKEFEAFLSRHGKSRLAEQARFCLAQALFYNGQFAAAAAAYDAVVAGKGPMAEAASFDKALAIYKTGELKKAAEAFIAAARDFPKSSRAGKARLYAGTCLYEAADYDGAILQFDAIIQSDKPVAPDEAMYWKGQALLKLNRPADAVATLAEAIRAHPESPRRVDMKLVQADALLAEGKQVEAADIYQDVALREGANASAPRALYNAALALHSAGKLAESMKLCEKFMADYPADKLLPLVLFLAGENQFRQGNYAAAGPLYRQLLDKFAAEASPNADKARLRLGWALYFQKQYSAALPPLEALSDKADEKLRREASYLKANCLLELNSLGEAAKALEAYVAVGGPKGEYADNALFQLVQIHLKQNDKDKALACLTRLVREFPDSTQRPQAEYQLAELALANRKFDDAIVHYQEVIGREPKGVLAAYAVFGIALCYYDQGKWKEAADAFASVATYPSNDKLLPQAIYRQGLCFQKLEQWAVAEDAFGKLLARFPKDPYAASALRAIGLGQEKQKNFEKAAETFTRLIADFPEAKDLDQAFYELAWCCQAMGKKDEENAAWKQLTEKCPTSPLAADAYFHLAEQHYSKREYDKALQVYQLCLASAKDDGRRANALFRLGWCYWMLARYEEAGERFDKVVNDHSTSGLLPDALLNAAQAYLKAGKPAAAADRLTKLVDGSAAKDFKFLPQAMVHLGEAQIALSQPDKALATFKTVRDKFPKADPAAVELGIGQACFELKQYDAAIRSLTAAVEHPDIPGDAAAKAQFYIAESYFASGQLRPAIKAYLRVTVIYAAFPEWIVASHYQLGQVNLELARKAAADNPQEAQIYRAEAVKQFTTVTEKFPQSKWAANARKQLEQLKG